MTTFREFPQNFAQSSCQSSRNEHCEPVTMAGFFRYFTQQTYTCNLAKMGKSWPMSNQDHVRTTTLSNYRYILRALGPETAHLPPFADSQEPRDCIPHRHQHPHSTVYSQALATDGTCEQKTYESWQAESYHISLYVWNDFVYSSP